MRGAERAFACCACSMAIFDYGADSMVLSIYRTKRECGAAAAAFGAGRIRAALEKKGLCRIVIATGASQFDMLDCLVHEPGIDWSRVSMFHLDEYVGLPESHPASFRKYIKERFVAKLPCPLGEANYVEGDAGDVAGAIAALGRHLQDAEVDVCFIGIGENGHIAFNDPPADFDTEEPYIVVNLDQACRRQQLGEGWFKTMDDVPSQAVSMTVRQIMKSRCIVNTVPDARKAEAMRMTFEDTLGPEHPAAIIRLHADCRTFCDADAAAKLSKITKELCAK